MVVVISGTNGIVAPGLTSEDSTGTTTLTTQTLVLGGTTVTATGAELNFVDGVTSAIQTQLNAKGTVSSLSDLSVTASASELNILDGATLNVNELNLLDSATITTAELNILDGVTATTAELNILDGVTATTDELNQLSGVSNNVQTQINAITLTPQVIRANTTAAAGNHYFLDSAGITLTLPASPSTGDRVGVTELVGDTTSIVAANGNNIMKDSADLTIDTAYLVAILAYTDDASVGWAFA